MHTTHLLPLESYKSRYTEYLATWELEAFTADKTLSVKQHLPQPVTALSISTGEVLDSLMRPMWAMDQIRLLLTEPSPFLGRIYFSDFFHPGLEALPYSRKTFKASAFCWAQTFDRFDFTRKFIEWMRPWELFASQVYSRVFVASTLLADLIMSAMPWMSKKLLVTGLPFNSTHVRQQVDLTYLPDDEFDVVYSSRWDWEKNPGFFVDLVEAMPDVTFAVCTGHPALRSNSSEGQNAITKLYWLANRRKNVRVFTGLTKGQYYAILCRSRVQFNCAFQDWVSFTLLEALSFGCYPLYPNERSFPEALDHVDEFLYVPQNLTSAIEHLKFLLSQAKGAQERFSFETLLRPHDQALKHIVTATKEMAL